MEQDKIVVFESKNIRRLWYEGEWFFSVIDVMGALTESVNPRDYWFKMKSRVATEDEFQLSTNCRQLKFILCNHLVKSPFTHKQYIFTSNKMNIAFLTFDLYLLSFALI